MVASNGGELNDQRPVSKHPLTLEGITPGDVLVRVQLLRNTLDLIRFEMGKPKAIPSDSLTTNGYSHEAHFQTLTLLLKSDRLALELTGSPGIPPEPISLCTIAPPHMKELGLKEEVSERWQDSSTGLTKTGRAIVETNRHLNLLLERPFSPSDVSHRCFWPVNTSNAYWRSSPDQTSLL